MPILEIIIPTRNRPQLLFELMSKIGEQTLMPKIVHVVDSSDLPIDLGQFADVCDFEIDYVHTTIKSASSQRNIGLERISNSCDLVAFLDDDVRPQSIYLETLVTSLIAYNLIGISAIAVDPARPTGFKTNFHIAKFYRRIFLLGSNTQGALLLSGVAVPVTNVDQGIVYSDWLIGCSIWEYRKIRNMRFPEMLRGQSLGEDVIFSAKASKLGALAVDTAIILHHLQSEINRPNSFDYWKMWASNRKILLQTESWGLMGYCAYYWANLGEFFILFGNFIRRRPKSLLGILGLIAGMFQKVRAI